MEAGREAHLAALAALAEAYAAALPQLPPPGGGARQGAPTGAAAALPRPLAQQRAHEREAAEAAARRVDLGESKVRGREPPAPPSYVFCRPRPIILAARLPLLKKVCGRVGDELLINTPCFAPSQ